MTINFETATIVMTKAEAKAAGKYGTEAYHEFMKIRAKHSEFSVSVQTPTSRKKSSALKLTYDYMQEYLFKYHKDLLQNFYTLTAYGEVGDAAKDKAAYTDVRNWFLEKCPEIKKQSEERRTSDQKKLSERRKEILSILHSEQTSPTPAKN